MMRIGIPREIKVHEYRVGMTPAAVREAVHDGHRVLIEAGAGAASGFDDSVYQAAGAQIAASAEEVFRQCDLIVKVKEPQPHECRMLREGQVLFAYLHLAPDPLQTELLQYSGCTAIAYETITDERGGLPLLAPMSEVAGRMAIQVGAVALQKANGGRGVLLGGVPGVAPGKVVVIGGGVAGAHAARMAVGLGADVTVLDNSLARLRYLDDVFGPQMRTLYATLDATEQALIDADLVVGAVLIPGAAAPKLVRRQHVSTMKPGSVLVDVSIDQGGCFETSKPTTHADPTYLVDGVVHYCVANMPSAVARTSTRALTHATLPFIQALAFKGWKRACREDPHLAAGVNVHAGQITYQAVAESLRREYTPVARVLA